ncbi:MAG: hypothetical protein RL112_1581, partial [Planctomycetota bacterium]
MDEFEIMDERHARLVAHALGELEGAERAAVEAELAASAEARAELARIEATLGLVEDALAESPRLSDEGRAATLAAARPAPVVQWWRRKGFVAAAGVAALAGGTLGWIHLFQPRSFGSRMEESVAMDSPRRPTGGGALAMDNGALVASGDAGAQGMRVQDTRAIAVLDGSGVQAMQSGSSDFLSLGADPATMAGLGHASTPPGGSAEPVPALVPGHVARGGGGAVAPVVGGGASTTYGGRVAKSRARPAGPGTPGPGTGGPPSPEPQAASKRQASGLMAAGDAPVLRESPDRKGEVVGFEEDVHVVGEVVDGQPALDRGALARAEYERIRGGCLAFPGESPRDMYFRFWGDNPFEVSLLDKQSTFGVDVDTASYALARRYVQEGRLPEKAQVRTEEFVNYFKAESPAPASGPFAIHAELAPSRFGGDQARQMLRVVVRAKDLAHFERKPLRLTFVVDVSGSMREQNRLETVKDSLRLLVAQLEPGDRVAIVKYSTDAALVAPMASVSDRVGFEAAIQSLSPEGGTNSNAGLQLGYAVAVEAFDVECVNRVVFLSDGVANQGVTDPRQIAEGIKPLKEKGILLNTIGVGMGNHNDVLLEQLADTCDGVCTYVDSPKEAKRALVDHFTGMFQPVGRDAKVQVEFDPSQVRRWRQLGYENRAIADADFRDDKVDAGEINAGHEMTALYELEMATPRADAPLAVVRLRWKDPRAAGRPAESDAAREMEAPVQWSRRVGFAGATHGYRRAVIVAQYAEFLRRSTHARGDRVEDLVDEARALRAERAGDAEWAEFVDLVERAAKLGLGAAV